MRGAHGDGHGHGVRPPGQAAGSALRPLAIALALTAGYTVLEVVAALVSGSLTLLADAGHNLSDVVALGVAAGAVLLARPGSRTS